MPMLVFPTPMPQPYPNGPEKTRIGVWACRRFGVIVCPDLSGSTPTRRHADTPIRLKYSVDYAPLLP
jgi:hypothetical protein